MARVMIWIVTAVAVLMACSEFEPLVRFRPVPATVLSAKLERRTMRMASGRSGSSRTRTGFVPAVSYRYEVNGASYVGSQYTRTVTLESTRAARKRMRGMVPGGTVRAWYNPSNPSEAVLSRTPNPILLAIMAAVVFLCWLFSLATGRRRSGVGT